MTKLSWFWGGHAHNAKTRTLTLVFTSFCYIAAFATAGIFSSRISSANSEVLLLPTEECGVWECPDTSLFEPDHETYAAFDKRKNRFLTNIGQIYRRSHAYVSLCHNFDGAVEAEDLHCLPLGKDRITWSTDVDVACPFEKDMCTDSAVQFDSGFISSHTHFGINNGRDRVEYRRVLTCAPIQTEGHVSGPVDAAGLNYTYFTGFNATDDPFLWFPDEKFTKYAYGQNSLFDDNTTYAYSDYTL